ncbi:MAG: tripartite tricarboxylate transporter permease [Acidocella sp.]|jgi:putative tricarboxylic transport membrane protein|nr:tripartite tricarboxylate transporter permease [Acidocella sp.]
MFSVWMSGFESLFVLKDILYLIAGVGFGMFFGLVPGLGGTTGLTLLIPLTFGLDTATSIALSAGVMGGVPMGGSISAILINSPGSAPNAATCLDGFPLAQKGKGGLAIGAAASANAMGGIIGTFALLLIIPLARDIVLSFGPPQFFLMCVFGLVIVSLTSSGKLLEGLLVGMFGLMISTIGYDAVTGDIRYAFGVPYLWNGIPLVPALIGLFPLTQMIRLFVSGGTIAKTANAFKFSETFEGVKATFTNWKVVLSGSLVGTLIGAIPGVGGVVAAFASYSIISQTGNDRETYGHGNIKGVIAPEAAINAKDCSTLIPTLAFGIPGSAEMAVFLAILILHGVDPGPLLMIDHQDLIYELIWALVAACVFASIAGVLLAKYLAKVTVIRANVLVPLVISISVLGSWAVNQNIGNIVVSLAFAVIGYIITVIDYPRLPLVISLILGGEIERYYDQSIMISGGTPRIFIEDPVSMFLLSMIVIAILYLPAAFIFKRLFKRSKELPGTV